MRKKRRENNCSGDMRKESEEIGEIEGGNESGYWESECVRMFRNRWIEAPISTSSLRNSRVSELSGYVHRGLLGLWGGWKMEIEGDKSVKILKLSYIDAWREV